MWKMSSGYQKENNILIIQDKKMRSREFYAHRPGPLFVQPNIWKQAGFSISLGPRSLWSLLCGIKLVLTRFVCLSPVAPSYVNVTLRPKKTLRENVASLHFCVLKPHVLILAQPTTSGELWLFNFSGTHYVQCKIIASMYYDSKSSRAWKELATQIQ